jgi:hypothetical protein
MGPLTTLAARLLGAAPPSLSHLIEVLAGGEYFETFLGLVREYLPECEAEILRERTATAQIALFGNRFGDRYFPLHDWALMEYGYEELVGIVPLIVQGIDWEDYHEVPESWRPGYQLLFALTVNPFEMYDDGARVPLLEACAAVVPQALVERIPAKGYAPEVLRQLLDGTELSGAADAADWLCSNTDTIFLDWPSDADHDVHWDPETIRELTEEWKQAELIMGRVHALAEWLEVDLPQRFGELLDFIDTRKGC